MQLYERRISQANKREAEILRKLGEKLMSDEETDSEDPNTLIKRSPPWRSEKLNLLFHVLDARYDSKKSSHSSLTKRNRKTGQVSGRPQPQGLPSWATSETNHGSASNTPTTPTSTDFPSTPTSNPSIPALTPPSTSTTPTNRVSSWQPGENLPVHTPVRDRPPLTNRLSFSHADYCTPPSSVYTPTSLSSDEDDDNGMENWIQTITGIRP